MWERQTLQPDVSQALADKAAIETKAVATRTNFLEEERIAMEARIALLELTVKRIKAHVKLKD